MKEEKNITVESSILIQIAVNLIVSLIQYLMGKGFDMAGIQYFIFYLISNGILLGLFFMAIKKYHFIPKEELLNQKISNQENIISEHNKDSVEKFKCILHDYFNPMMGCSFKEHYREPSLIEMFECLNKSYSDEMKTISNAYNSWYINMKTTDGIKELQDSLHMHIHNLEDFALRCSYKADKEWETNPNLKIIHEVLFKYQMFISNLESFYLDVFGKIYGYNGLDDHLNIMNWLHKHKGNYLHA